MGVKTKENGFKIHENDKINENNGNLKKVFSKLSKF